jgi:hypothetical protein
MRTLFFALAFLVLLPGASACDVCGCSIGGNYFGILPQFHRHFMGMRWSSETSYTSLSADALRQKQYHSVEEFTSADMIIRFYPVRRWQLLVLAPYRWNHQTEYRISTRVHGLGDVSLLANYVLLNTGDSLHRSWRQTLSLGGGLKLPTGRNNLTAADGGPLHPNIQPGTGSTDFLLSAAYTLRRGAWGASTDLLARWNTANSHNYHFGNRLSGSAKLFYWSNLRHVTVLPNAGVFLDAAEANRDDDELLTGSNGITTLATLGLDVYTGHFSAGVNYQPPIWQSRKTVRTNARWIFTLNYIF